ncbi:uncharacterized protein [Palaemon carinicauda]|uniref:uncharacterized protein isoform X1 n=1 Tax=Palaemon carinicauda TaxID=392227 RepID=UPI0035B5A938
MASRTSKECGICNEVFDEIQNCPKNLPCSHCICMQCIDQLIKNERKLCPFCRRPFEESSAQAFATNLTVLGLVKYVSELEASIQGRHQQTDLDPFVNLLKNCRLENREITLVNIERCKQSATQVMKAIQNNDELIGKLRSLNDKLRKNVLGVIKGIESSNSEQIAYLQHENESLMKQLDSLGHQETHIQDTDIKLENALDFTTSGKFIDEAKEINSTFNTFVEDLTEFVDNNKKSRNSIAKAVEKLNCEVAAIEEILSSRAAEDNEEVSLTPGMVAMAYEEDVPGILTIDYFRKLRKPLLQAIEGGRVYATPGKLERFGSSKQRPGYSTSDIGQIFAKVRFDECGQLCLHHLEETTLPSPCHLIKFSELLELVDNSSRLAFIELGARGRSLGRRLWIRLFPDTIKAQQFALLCTGEKGPCYAGTTVFAVANRGHKKEESVCFGDYEWNNGSGGKAILQDIDWELEVVKEVYDRTWEAGIVSCSEPEHRAAQFAITTQNWCETECIGGFGKLERGLSILNEVISEFSDIKECFIHDCGIALFP